ncbi:MAG: DUF1287 domain-containing protein [Caulobacter sp.]|nr:DUF1287 domain-containing protein [Caulobacter sp.]
MLRRRFLLTAVPAVLAAAAVRAEPGSHPLVAAARRQVGVTVRYDPAYVRLAYPGGDLPRDRGVCTDVVIRAYRAAFLLDLQKLVHEDMARNFAAYPTTWGLRGPDRNIDHRRVPNLETFLTRRGAALPLSAPWEAGDLITQRLPGNLPHIAIFTGERTVLGQAIVIHNIGGGTQVEVIPAFARNVARFHFMPNRG